jgi:AcrR family transcriptional regulator
VRAQARGEQTRAQILDAAEKSIARQGYSATSVDDICQAAGVTKGGFYHHFSSKQALFLELVESWLSKLDVRLEAVGADAATVPERLLRMGKLGGEVFQQRSGQLRILLEFWEQAAHDPMVWEAATAPFRRYQDSLAALIESGIAEGTLQRVDARIAGQTIVSLGVGLILQGVLDPQGSDWGQVVQESLRMLVDGLRRRD